MLKYVDMERLVWELREVTGQGPLLEVISHEASQPCECHSAWLSFWRGDCSAS